MRGTWRSFRNRDGFSNGAESFTRRGICFKQPDLARTLRRIEADPQVLYKGAMAKELAASSIEAHGGLVSAADLAGYTRGGSGAAGGRRMGSMRW